MRAFHNDATLKTRLLAEIANHVRLDQLIKGTYGQGTGGDFKGCAVGCALHSLNRIKGVPAVEDRTNAHDRFPAELGIPIELAYLIDNLFERLPDALSQIWPARVIAAMRPGADLSGVVSAAMQWAILDPVYGWIVCAKTLAQYKTVKDFARLVAKDWREGSITDAAWHAIDARLDEIPGWAWAGARARAGAWAGARARAWAWAWAGVEEEWYTALSEATIRAIEAAPQGK